MQDGRAYLADEVSAQREELTKIGKEVASVTATVSTLLEAENRATAYRNEMWREVGSLKQEVVASRSEQQQVIQSIVATQGSITEIKKLLLDHEAERQQAKGALGLAKSSAKIAWSIIGATVLGAVGLIAYFVKVLAQIPWAKP